MDQMSPKAYQVVVNHEGRHSVWRADNSPPLGWRSSGPAATREECLARIGVEWPDIRPKGPCRSAPDEPAAHN